jgi:hypothetical protein
MCARNVTTWEDIVTQVKSGFCILLHANRALITKWKQQGFGIELALSYLAPKKECKAR